MKRHISAIFFLTLALYACSKDNINKDSQNNRSLDFIVFADPHYFAPELGVGEPAFYRDKMTETKLTEQSKKILSVYLDEIAQSDIKNIIICGDLTHNGEKYNHLQVAEMLKQLKDKGKNIYLIPGNHDVNNPYAARFKGVEFFHIDNISPKEFAGIYNDFGYSQAFSRESKSLSYAAQLDNKYDLICLDASRYDEYREKYAPSGGKLKKETLEWLNKILEQRKALGKKFIAVLHHNLIEHFPGQSINPVSNSYILQNSAELMNIMNKYNIQLIFTGHFHANDIACQGDIYDIETGSAITYPHSYRIVSINDTIARINTRNINYSALDSGNINFAEYSKNKTSRGLNNFFHYHLDKSGKMLNADLIKKLRENFAKVVFTHYYGDEKIDDETSRFCDSLINSNDKLLNLIGVTLKSIYRDTYPGDRNIKIKLK